MDFIGKAIGFLVAIGAIGFVGYKIYQSVKKKIEKKKAVEDAKANGTYVPPARPSRSTSKNTSDQK